MRWALAVVLVVVFAMGGTGAAAQTTQLFKYWMVTGRVDITWGIDYGSHPDGVFNGKYEARLSYNFVGIAERERGQLSTRQRLAVTGNGSVADARTVWTGGERAPVPCQENPTHEVRFAKRSSGSHVSLGRGLLNIDPGNAIRWAVGCAATESNAIHGLPDGKTISGAASGISGVVACRDSFTHQFTGGPNGHSFFGTASFFVRFQSIPKSQIADARRVLRNQQGRTIRPRWPAAGRWQGCIR
jgi:hypothetical protein